MRARLLGLLVLVSLPLHAMIDYDQQRISPVGNVHVQEPAQAANPAVPVPQEAVVKKAPGQATYEQYCVVCHRDGVAGAPKFRDATDWAPRRAKQDITSLTATAVKGLNAMPAKGTCQECSDADLKAAIEYMVPSS